ncbi:MAG: hypothetical protein U0354_05435 [Candidatus Sericytochromatia bacterium]
MSNDEKNKKIEALEKMFGTKDELKLSGDKPNVKKQQEIPPPETEQPKELELKEEFKLPEQPKEKKEPVKQEVDNDEYDKSITSKITPSKDFPLNKLKENLKPEVKDVIKKLEGVVTKESVTKLINVMENNKNVIFDEKVTTVFNNLSAGEASLLGKKLAEWDIPKEASEVNASVILAWLNKTKK